MYTRRSAVGESTRVKLFMTKHRMENNSNFSDAYVRLFNRSLKRRYVLWIKIEHWIWEKIHGIFKEGDRIPEGVMFVGRFSINLCKKLTSQQREDVSLLHSGDRREDEII